MTRRVAACLLAAGLVACRAEPPVVLDGSSPQTFERSASSARRQLPDADRIVFDRALRSVGGRRLANRDPAALARTTFDGMTAAEVVADQQAHER